MQEALLLPAQAIAAALDSCLPATHAAIIGQGLLAAITEGLLTRRGVSLAPATEKTVLPLLIDTTGEPSKWSQALPALQDEGTLLLLVPPWSEPIAYNFYPHLHRRSLRVVARRWHYPLPLSDDITADSLYSLVSTIVREGQWVRPFDHPNTNPDEGVWRWLLLTLKP